MKLPRIIEVRDAHERALLIARQDDLRVPAVYVKSRDSTLWCDETELYKWRKDRIDAP